MHDPLMLAQIRSAVGLVDFVSKTVELKPQGDDFFGLCPFHQENTPSFSITPENGLFYCHGCRAGGDIFSFVRQKHRVGFSDAVKILAIEAGIELDSAPQSAEYIYLNADSQNHLRVKRYYKKDGKKTFAQSRWDGTRWVTGSKSIERILYRLPEILTSDYVLIVEGEKDCHTARDFGLEAQLGAIATTSPGGATKWVLGAGERWLKDKRVVIIPDRDEAGDLHCRQVLGDVPWARVLKLPHGKDLTEYIEGGGTVEELVGLIEGVLSASDRNGLEQGILMSDRNGHEESGDARARMEFDVLTDNETILSLEHEIIQLKEKLVSAKPRSSESTTVNREIDAKERKLKVMKQQAKLLERKDEEEKTAFECDLEAIELFADRLRLNILTGEIEFDNKPLPGAGIRSFLAKKTGHRGWKTSDNSVWEICEDMASDNQYCPVQEYLDGLDAGLFEEGFLETLALKLYGTTDNLQAEYLKLTLIGSVARAYNRGAHHPSMLILYSQKHQVGKSSSIRTLYGKEFSGEGLLQMDNKDGQISMKNCWAYELAEVNKIFNTKDAETMKSFITLETDLYREHYGRKNKRVPRFSILWGTTNQPEFFTDETGNVRYFVIELKDDHMLDLEWLKNNRDKIWTCAKELYLRGESNLLAFNKREEQEKQNKERMTRDPWEEIIEEYLAKHNVPFITCTKLLLNCLDCYTKDITRADSNRVGRILRKLGYTLSEKTERDLTDGGKVGKQWKKLEPAPTKENKEF